MNNSIIKLIITLVTFSGISLVVSDSSNKRSPSTEGVIVGPDTPVIYVECPLNDCLVLNKSINKFVGSSSYYNYRNPEYNFSDTFFPKILVVLDWDDKMKNGEQEILNDVLTKWNEADKILEQLGNSKIKLAIAGVVIPTQSDIWRSTDPRKNSSELNEKYTSSSVINNITKWLIDNSDRFGSLNYDLFVFVSREQLAYGESFQYVYVNNFKGSINCDIKNGSHNRLAGTSVLKTYPVSRYVFSIAVMLGFRMDENLGCKAGHILSFTKYNENPTWSECSKREFISFINNIKYSCLHQIPYGQYEDDCTIFRKHF